MLWLSSPSFRNYEVSENGDVRHFVSKRIKRQTRLPSGYLVVTLSMGTSTKLVKVHRLVCEAWWGLSQGRQVCHADGTRDNNHYRNLRWGDAKENSEDRRKHGRMSVSRIALHDKDELRLLAREGVSKRLLARIYGISLTHAKRLAA